MVGVRRMGGGKEEAGEEMRARQGRDGGTGQKQRPPPGQLLGSPVLALTCCRGCPWGAGGTRGVREVGRKVGMYLGR